MHVKKMSKSDKLVVLFLATLFIAGVGIGAGVASLPLRDKPEAHQAISQEAEPKTEPIDEPTEEPVVEILTNLGEFKTTAYCTCEKCCGKWADGYTASGTKATPGRTIAVDPDVIPLGSTVFIDGNEYIAEDVGGAVKGKHVDILFPTHGAAQQYGIRYIDVLIKE